MAAAIAIRAAASAVPAKWSSRHEPTRAARLSRTSQVRFPNSQPHLARTWQAKATAGAREVLEVMPMPRSVQDILDHADELAKRFEDYEPSPEDEVAVGEYLLRRAALARARTERQVSEAVALARKAGISWKRIGAELGISAQAAQQRYRPLTKPA